MKEQAGKNKKHADLQDRLIDFSVRVIKVADSLASTRTGNQLRGQLLRCGTSPPANYAEAQSAESRADFVHKLKIVLKELRETKVWLLILIRASLIKPEARLQPLVLECDELISIFVKSVNTARKNAGL